MQERMYLQVVTTTTKALEVTVKEIYIPAFLGEAGVLEDHKPYISLLKSGEINYVDIHDKKHYLYIHEGFIEVLKNNISIVSDSVETGESLDRDEIENKLAELDVRIKSAAKGEISPENLVKALEEQREYMVKQKILQKMESKK